MLLLPLPLLLLLVRLNLLVLFPGALPLASAGVGGFDHYFIIFVLLVPKVYRFGWFGAWNTTASRDNTTCPMGNRHAGGEG
jgi:hypothetical protein